MLLNIVYSKQHDTVRSDEDVDNVCILIEMIEVLEGWGAYNVFNNGDVDFIMYNLCVD